MMQQRFHPSNRLQWLMAALVLLWALAMVATLFFDVGLDIENINTAALFMLFCIGTAAVIDFWLLRTGRPIEVARYVPETLPVNISATAELKLRNPCGYAVNIALYDHHPKVFEVQSLPLNVILPAKGEITASYQFVPKQRSDHSFSQLDALQSSAFGLWKRVMRFPLITNVKVYPNFAAIAGYTLLSTDNHVSQLGIRKRMRRGQGTDFHQLREYRDGDSLRQIDWNATAKWRKVISREYQDERNQQVIFLLDSGRKMRAKEGDLSHFDHAVNAMVLLGFIAARQGDFIGLHCFGGHERNLPPSKGSAVVNSLLNSVYDIEPTTAASDFVRAAESLLLRQRKRSLVVILTNTRDDSIDDLTAAAKLLQRRHVVLVANLRETAFDDVLQQPVDTFETAIRYAGMKEFLHKRKAVHDALAGLGVFALDCTPQQLPTRVVNAYFDIKRSGYL